MKNDQSNPAKQRNAKRRHLPAGADISCQSRSVKRRLAVQSDDGQPAPLCYRCEHRARHLEDPGYQPRYECGNTSKAVWCCYMYRPVRPMVLRSIAGDRRPFMGPSAVSSRMQGRVVKPEEIDLALERKRDGNLIYWTPTRQKRRVKK